MILPLKLTVALLIAAPALAAEEARSLPKWEAGIAVGAASLPQYMGSDERYLFAAPIPYFIYRGERLKIDRGGITTALFGVKNLSLDASLGIGLPVRNSNQARAGMPELKFSLQAGPRLNWQLIKHERGSATIRLPWRAVMDSSGNWLGWVSEPDLSISYRPDPDLKLRLSSGLLFGSRQFHHHYYGVDLPYVTATRPAYRARAGLHSLSLSAIASYRISDRWSLFSAMRYRNLAAGVVTGSPLVKDRNYLSATIGMSWSIWQSQERVTADD